VYYHTKA